MNILEVKNIKKSIELMDKFEDGDYDYLELKDWFTVRKSHNTEFSLYDNSGRLGVSLMVSTKPLKDMPFFTTEPTMTEIRQIQHHSFCLDIEYPECSIYNLLKKSCLCWKTNEFITLEKQICLRAQTSFNRMDYGCEWLGGGDWEEKTLYGETTDFFITGIILNEPYKFPEQEAKEIIESLQLKYDETQETLLILLDSLKKYDGPVISKSFGEGFFNNFTDGRVFIKFSERVIQFQFPESIINGFITIPAMENYIAELKALSHSIENLKNEINELENAINPHNFMRLFELIHNKYHK